MIDCGLLGSFGKHILYKCFVFCRRTSDNAWAQGDPRQPNPYLLDLRL